MANDTQMLIGKITSSHGVRGLVKVDLYIESTDIIASLDSVNDEDGNKLFDIKSLVKHKNLYLVKLEGIDSRDDSDALRNTKLYLDESLLPSLNEDEFFVSDLEGLKVKDSNNEDFGVVRNVFNFGAGDVLEIVRDSGDYYMLTFTKDTVPTVDIENGFIQINEESAISNKGEVLCTK
ncbi:MAG: ribosome maturation factor RimM [Alphaproteobacteria bacterium]|jgi:16S rRNA processing protein RimM|nr:ribosome maturation factor RimM [Alphaproteobacteria bacterium]